MGKISRMGYLGLWMGLPILLVGTHANGGRDPVVDQSFDAPLDLGASLNEGFVFTAQTYTASITGRLAGVAVDVLAGGTFPLRVSIHSTRAGVPTARVLGERTLTTNGSSLTEVITFPERIQQVSGKSYAIVLDYPTAPPHQGQATWAGVTGNPYPGGDYFESDNAKTWSLDGSGGDLHFKTFVTRTRGEDDDDIDHDGVDDDCR